MIFFVILVNCIKKKKIYWVCFFNWFSGKFRLEKCENLYSFKIGYLYLKLFMLI